MNQAIYDQDGIKIFRKNDAIGGRMVFKLYCVVEAGAYRETTIFANNENFFTTSQESAVEILLLSINDHYKSKNQERRRDVFMGKTKVAITERYVLYDGIWQWMQIDPPSASSLKI